MYQTLDEAMANTAVVTSSVYLLFIAGCLYLFVGVPYYILKFFALKKFRSQRMNYVYQHFHISETTESTPLHLKKAEIEKLDLLIHGLEELAPYITGKTVKRTVQKVCGYVPDGLLILLSVLAVPLTSTFVVFICSTLGDDYFLGFFMLLGFLGLAPFLFIFLSKINSTRNEQANSDMQHHTARLLDFLQNK